MSMLESMAPARDRAAINRMLVHAFASASAGVEEWMSAAGDENFRVLVDGGRAAATLLRIPMGQYFGGKSVPMLGVAGVAVAPEDRGKSYAKRMMREFVTASAAEGWALSGLYASTQSLYRSVGYEHGGSMCEYTVPVVRVSESGSAGEFVALGDGDMEAVRACYARFARRFDGALDRGNYIWARIRKAREDLYSGFGVRDGAGGLAGYVFIHQKRLVNGRQSLHLSDLAFNDAETGRRLLGFIGGYGMMAEELTFKGGPTHPALELLKQSKHRTEIRELWLTRVLDVKRALEARGYPQAAAGEVHLEIDDELVEANRGAWALKVAGGAGAAQRGGRGAVKCGVRGLAAMYTGFLTASQAKLAGLADGDDAELAKVDGLFGGGSPWTSDFF